MRLRLYMHSSADYLRSADYRILLRKAGTLFYSDNPGIVVLKDLTEDASPAKARATENQTRIRPASREDVLTLIGTHRPDTDSDDLWQRRLRRHIVDTLGVDGCFVADVPEIGPSFMQYLFTSVDNDRLQTSFPGSFPVMTPAEAIVEFLYVAPEVRSPGLAVDGIVQVTGEARRRGADSVISFIDPTNKGALFVNHLAGFRAGSVRRSRRRFFRKTYAFEPWPADTSQRLIDLASGRARIS